MSGALNTYIDTTLPVQMESYFCISEFIKHHFKSHVTHQLTRTQGGAQRSGRLCGSNLGPL